MRNNTIVAIATPPGKSAIGIIRLSGPLSLKIMRQLISRSTEIEPRRMYFDTLKNKKTKSILDEVCWVYFKSPHSYTGEDIIEINTHGNPLLLKQAVLAALDLGATLAAPGEFSRRAFINGKIDLTKAESIIELIDAKNECAKQVALNHLNGSLLKKITLIRTQLMDILTQIEAHIDFPDDLSDQPFIHALPQITRIKNELKHMLSIQDFGAWVHTGIQIAIIGRPNVGKSSLINSLAGEDKAIVTDIPGTTRDLIEVPIELNGLSFLLTDTAGLRKTKNPIELMGQKKVTEALSKSDIILWVLDGADAYQKEDQAIYLKIKKRAHVIMLINKSDKSQRFNPKAHAFPSAWPQLHIAAKHHHGLSDLKKLLVEKYTHKLNNQDLSLLCNIRQTACLKKACGHLKKLEVVIKKTPDSVIIAEELRAAILPLGELTGAEINEQVLDKIFSRFCIGK